MSDPKERIAQLEAQCAAMREALEHCRQRPHEHNPGPEFTVTQCEVIDRALARDCGKALLERLRSAEDTRDDLLDDEVAQRWMHGHGTDCAKAFEEAAQVAEAMDGPDPTPLSCVAAAIRALAAKENATP